MTDPVKTLYLPVWISNQAGRDRGTSLCRGPLCDTAAQAAEMMKARVREGSATMGCVVKLAGGVKTPMTSSVYPTSARRVVLHWEAIWDVFDPPVTGATAGPAP